jgi:hemolysin activation/secretion protein
MNSSPMNLPRLSALALLAMSASVTAQTTPVGIAAPTRLLAAAPVTFAITGFQITGDNPLAAGAAERAVASFVRPDATLETLQKAASALESTLRDGGFALYRVVLPPQQISATVALNIVKFTVGTVSVQGNQQFDEANIRRSLPELQAGTTPNFKRVAVQTTMANENQGKQVQVGMKESTVPDTIDVTVNVKETKPWQAAVTVNNAGNAATGRDRATLALGHSNLFNRDHQLTAAYTTSLEQNSRIKQVGLAYRAPLYDLRSAVGVSYTQSDVAGSFGTFNSTGAGRTMGVNYTFFLAPHQGYRSAVTAGLDEKQFEVTQINGLPMLGQQVRRSRQLSLGYNGRMESDASFWNYSAELATNLAGGLGNNTAAYQSEDPRIVSARWNALRANASYSAKVGGNWLVNARGSMQHSPNAMIAGEQFGVGGAATVRGAPERALAADRGVIATLEVATPELTKGLRLLGFVDSGWLHNNLPNGANKVGSDQLRSAGLGLRYGTPDVAVSADYGRIVTGSSVPLTLNSASPQKGDQKVHVNVTARF